MIQENIGNLIDKKTVWAQILSQIINKEDRIPSPFHPDGILAYRYVMVAPSNRLGYLLVWCTKSFKGAQFSRIGIPEDSKYVLVEEIELNPMPIIELVEVDWTK